MKFLILILTICSSVALADKIQKVSYQCKGNARVFLGPNEIPTIPGKSFKVEVPGGVVGLNLRVGQLPASPDFEVAATKKGVVQVALSAAVPLVLTADGPVALQAQNLQVTAKKASVRVDATGLRVAGEDGAVQIYQQNYQGALLVSSQDGNISFKTSDEKTLDCQVKVQ
jgi:hypothetical protein